MQRAYRHCALEGLQKMKADDDATFLDISKRQKSDRVLHAAALILFAQPRWTTVLLWITNVRATSHTLRNGIALTLGKH